MLLQSRNANYPHPRNHLRILPLYSPKHRFVAEMNFHIYVYARTRTCPRAYFIEEAIRIPRRGDSRIARAPIPVGAIHESPARLSLWGGFRMHPRAYPCRGDSRIARVPPTSPVGAIHESPAPRSTFTNRARNI